LKSTWKQVATAAPGIGVSLLPKLACPACWPAYAGLASSVGLGFLVGTEYLLPLTIAFLLLALLAMAFRARVRCGYRPLLLGLFASVGIVLGKFAWDSRPLLYGAVGMLIVASIWNTLPQSSTSCPAYATTNLAKGIEEE
jgi:hypothetical protein